MQRMSRQTRLLVLTMLSAALLSLSATYAPAVEVGDKAPDFALPATTAKEIKLADYLGKQPVVLFFFFGAFTGP